ncbi:MAG: hemerythrin family protein [Bryobacteraceae bacterium]|nr:hemerythrin family protein [Bryobacteraceae bacterium]
MGGIIAELIEYTKAHFGYEERMMKLAAYPDYEVHKLQHDRLAARVLEFHKEYAAGRVLMSLDVMEFLKNWLQTHIKGPDKNYSPFLNAKGIR